MKIERNAPCAEQTAQRGQVRRVAALAVAIGMLLPPTQALAAPPNNMPPPAGQRAPDGVQRASHAEMVPADRSFTHTPQSPMAQRTASPSARATEAKTRLAAQSSTRERNGGAPSGGARQLLATGASLTIVLALFAAVVWTMRRGMPKVLAQRLPNDVLDVLGQATLVHRQQVQLVRLGQKLLLINVSPGGAETLTEVIDPAEVDRLTALCRGVAPRGATPSFRDVLQQFRGPGIAAAATRSRSSGLESGKSEVTDG